MSAIVCDNCPVYNEQCTEHLYSDDDCTKVHRYVEANRYKRTQADPQDSYPFLPGVVPWRLFKKAPVQG